MHTFRAGLGRTVALFVIFSLAASVVLAVDVTYSGYILSGAQYDLYTVHLEEGDHVTATLVCDESAPNIRPLDPVLSVYFPGSDPSDTINSDRYNDDGFGLDDDPSGVECDAFDSSRIRFTAPEAGDYIFRADGFGSATGPYTLHIISRAGGGDEWFEPGDDRINRQAYATASIYCDVDNSRVLILGIDATGHGTEVLSVPYADLPATPTGSNLLIAQNANIAFYRLTSGEYQVNAGPDAEGKTYVAIWNGCPMTYQNAYILQNGVLTQTEANGPR